MRITSVVCPFCGALCDDIEIEVEGDAIKGVKKGCALSRSFFLSHAQDLSQPLVDGREVELEEALEEAARILARADYPLIYGLSCTTIEAQRKAMELADLLGANIDSTSSICHGPTGIAMQMVGVPTCTLGEIKNRADFLVFWGCNPAESHPRHFSRYSALAKGLLTPGGRRDRTVVVVDVRPSASSHTADIFLQIKPNGDFECLWVLRALLKGEKVDLEEVSGIAVEELRELSERMKRARFGVLLFGMGLTMTRGRHLNVLAALTLTRDLNQFCKFAAIPMRGHGNVSGIDALSAWQTGYPFGVNFSRGYPQYNPGEFTTVDILARKEVDAALIIASDPYANLPLRVAQRLEEIPTIVMDPKRSKTAQIARVVISTAISGVSAEGTAYRMDDVPLRLKRLISSPYPSDHEVLDEIIRKVKKCSGYQEERSTTLSIA